MRRTLDGIVGRGREEKAVHLKSKHNKVYKRCASFTFSATIQIVSMQIFAHVIAPLFEVMLCLFVYFSFPFGTLLVSLVISSNICIAFISLMLDKHLKGFEPDELVK